MQVLTIIMSDAAADDGGPSSSSRDRVLDAALNVFGEKGYAGATTKEIALRAGVNEVTLFRIFNNKMGLISAVIKERTPRSQLLKELHFDRGLDMRKILVDNSSRLLNIFHANRNLVRILVLDLPRLEGIPHDDPISSTFTGPLSGYLASHMDGGVLRDIDPEVAAEVLYRDLRSFFIDHYLFRDKAADPTFDLRFINTAVSIYLGGVRKELDEPQPTPGRKSSR